MRFPFTAAELTAYGSFLSGVGTIALAVVAFYGVYKWKEQATYKDRFDLARDAVEASYELLDLSKNLRTHYNVIKLGIHTYAHLKTRTDSVQEKLTHYKLLQTRIKVLFGAKETKAIDAVVAHTEQALSTAIGFYALVDTYSQCKKDIRSFDKEHSSVYEYEKTQELLEEYEYNIEQDADGMTYDSFDSAKETKGTVIEPIEKTVRAFIASMEPHLKRT